MADKPPLALKKDDLIYAKNQIGPVSYTYVFAKVVKQVPSGRFRISSLDTDYDESTREGGKGWNTIRVIPANTSSAAYPDTPLIKQNGFMANATKLGIWWGRAAKRGLCWKLYNPSIILTSHHHWDEIVIS